MKLKKLLKKLKERSKLPLKERRKLEKIAIFKKYILEKRTEIEKNKFLTFN